MATSGHKELIVNLGWLSNHVQESTGECHVWILSLFLQRCPTCFDCLTWMVYEMGGKWPYSCCLMECSFKDLFKTALSILVWFPSSFFFFSLQSVSLEYKRCNHAVVLIRLQLGRIPVLFYQINQISRWSITCQ